MFTTNDKGEAYEKGTLHCGALETYVVQHPAGRFGDFTVPSIPWPQKRSKASSIKEKRWTLIIV